MTEKGSVEKEIVEKLFVGPNLASVRLSDRKLNGSNWQQWQIIVMTNLTGRGKDHHLTDDPPDPKTAAWIKDDSLVKGLLWEVMEQEVMDLVLTCSTAKEMWMLLQSTYSGKSSMSRAYSISQAYSRSDQGSRSLEEHFAAFKKTCDELRSIFPLEANLEKMKARQDMLDVLTFIGSLNSSYEAARPLVIGSNASKNL